jgi:hypothetical protein
VGFALFPLRTPSGTLARVLVNASAVVALKEEPPGDLTGKATVQLASGAEWKLAEDVLTVYQRLKAAAIDPDQWAIYGFGFKSS